MSIESAKFIVQRGASQFYCRGDELKDKLEDGDLMVVQHDSDDEASKWEVETAKEPPWLPLYEGKAWHISPEGSGTNNVKVQNAEVIYYAETFEQYTGSPTSLQPGIEYVVCGPRVSFKNSTSDFLILEQYTDTSQFKEFSSLFYNCEQFKGNGIAFIDTKSAEYLSYMFTNCYQLGLATENCSVAHFDLTNVVLIKFMFSFCTHMNFDLNSWDVDQIMDFSGLFSHCHQFTQDLTGWDTASATTMASMFLDCPAFNGSAYLAEQLPGFFSLQRPAIRGFSRQQHHRSATSC